MAAVWTPSVRTIVNGTPVDAATTNGPVLDLTNRTDWLKSQLASVEAGTSIKLSNQTVESGLAVGAPVYLDTTTNVFKGAIATIDASDLNRAGPETFWQGFVSDLSGTTAEITLCGSMTQLVADWATVFEDGVFASGDLYLSSVTPGKVTTSPGTTGVYLGHLRSTGELLVRSGNQDTFLNHVHYQRTALGKPAGTLVDPAPGGVHVITTPDPAQQGWLPATSTYFPGFVVGTQIPTGAKFGYNLQHVDEADLRDVFPVVPANNAQFEQGGSILGSSLIVVNSYGIWWLDDSYGNAPWPVDYGVSGLYTNISLWTTRLIASQTIVDLIVQTLIGEFEAGNMDALSVNQLFSGNEDDLAISASDGDSASGYTGQVTVTNRGVTAARYGRGLRISSGTGDNTTGYKLITDFELAADLPAQHMWTELAGGGDTKPLLTTNGAASGTVIGARGHRLGPDAADYVDFVIDVGTDLEPAQDYQVNVVIKGAVNTVAGARTAREVDVSFYRLQVGSPVSSTQFVRTVRGVFYEGVPGELQRADLGTYADVVLRQNEQLLVRVKNSTGGNPLPVDTLRITSVLYGLAKP